MSRPWTVIDMPTPGDRPLLERLVFSGIVFNMSWEDPEMDRRAFNLTSRDTVISITSAGCNPLNFLTQSPARLISVDGNPAQNAVMELKLATIATQDHGTFIDIFAARRPAVVSPIYRRDLRPLLSDKSRAFWDKNLWMAHRGLYNFGKMGLATRLVRAMLPLLGLRRPIMERFFEISDLDEQRAYYHKHIAPRLWGPLIKRLCESQTFMYFCGVHPTQLRLIDGRHGIYEFVKERIEYALTQVPIYDNYFLSVTATGRFRGNRVPPYLAEENFDTLRENLDRVTVVNGWLGPYLDSQPAGSIQKFNLLDIFDWMTPEMFESTLNSVLRAAAPGATMIYRSGSYTFDPPPSILSRVRRHDDIARELFSTDRSATYGSFYVLSTPDEAPARSSRRVASA
ncbi:MAG: BtaA family protein [Phycisphaerales bacterium]|nr:BtaA family protein [Phycisphaerales bacterium]